MKKKILIVFLICCMLLGVASPAFADTSVYPPYNYTDDFHYIIGSNYISGKTVLIRWDPFINVVYASNMNALVFNGDDPNNGRYTVAIYEPTEDNSSWVSVSSFNLGGSIGDKTYKFTNPVEGDTLIYDYDGVVFFSPPLLLDLGILEVKMSLLLNQAVGMIQTLLPYGISCLALLISLPLLLKVLRRFLG